MNDGKICVSVCAAGVDEMIGNIRRAEKYADVIEVRFDCIATGEELRLIENLPLTDKTYLFTFRPREQGGRRKLSVGERLKFWESVFQKHSAGFMIDVECDPPILASVDPVGIERIVSQHYFETGAENHESAWETISAMSAGPVKIAVMTDDAADAIGVWNLLRRANDAKRKLIPIAMGEAGKWTRVLGPAHGAFMTYAALDEGAETAPGQIGARDLVQTYRVKEIDQSTKVYGVIGDPVSLSLSAFLHNPAFAALGINAVFVPLLVRDLDGFMGRMVCEKTREVELNFGGFSVTMPHKQSIMQYLDVIHPTAKNIGAVNTVKIHDGKLTGYNTDAYGFITPLREKYGPLTGARVAVHGAGGAARACVYALQQENAVVTVFARDPAKAGQFGEEFNVAVEPINNTEAAGFDILVNATPLGMLGSLAHQSLYTAEQLDGVKLVYDLVTKPFDTPMIREAKQANIQVVEGIEMLLAQGAMQFELWTGQKAPIEKMKESLKARNREV